MPLHNDYYEYGLLRARNIITGLPKALWSGFPQLTPKQTAAFLAGYLEETAHLTSPSSLAPTLVLIDDDEAMLEGFVQWTKQMPTEREQGRYIKYEGPTALDALGTIYLQTVLGTAIREGLFKWLQKTKISSTEIIEFTRTKEEAIQPAKARITGAGYEMTAIEQVSCNSDYKVYNYDTGLTVKLPFGTYAQLTPHPDLAKLGYTIAGSPLIIDHTYKGNIIIPLVRMYDKAPSIWPAFKAAYLIPFKALHFDTICYNRDINGKTEG